MVKKLRVGLSLYNISCFNNIEIANNLMYVDPNTPVNLPIDKPAGIETSCGATSFYVVNIHNNTIMGMYYAIQAEPCNSFININNNYLTDNTYCIYGGGSQQIKYNVSCNTMKNATYGFYSATTGTIPGFINQGTSSAPAANKFINVTNPIYQLNSVTGAWTYNQASDEGFSNPQGPGLLYVTVTNTGISVLSRCGTGTPGLRFGNAEADKTEISGFFVYPNPFNDELFVDFVAETNGDYLIEVMNVLGASVHITKGVVKEGQNHVGLHLTAIGGMYMLRLHTDGKIVMKKIVRN